MLSILDPDKRNSADSEDQDEILHKMAFHRAVRICQKGIAIYYNI